MYINTIRIIGTKLQFIYYVTDKTRTSTGSVVYFVQYSNEYCDILLYRTAFSFAYPVKSLFIFPLIKRDDIFHNKTQTYFELNGNFEKFFIRYICMGLAKKSMQNFCSYI